MKHFRIVLPDHLSAFAEQEMNDEGFEHIVEFLGDLLENALRRRREGLDFPDLGRPSDASAETDALAERLNLEESGSLVWLH